MAVAPNCLSMQTLTQPVTVRRIMWSCLTFAARAVQVSWSPVAANQYWWLMDCMSLPADKTRLMRLGQSVTLNFRVPPRYKSLSGTSGVFCLISLENRSLILHGHSVWTPFQPRSGRVTEKLARSLWLPQWTWWIMTAVNNVKCGLWRIQDLKCHLNVAEQFEECSVLKQDGFVDLQRSFQNRGNGI